MAMGKRTGGVHVATTRRHYKGKEYESTLLRRSYREGGKVKNETLGNLSHLPDHVIDGAGHWIQRERAAAVNDLLLAFLRSL